MSLKSRKKLALLLVCGAIVLFLLVYNVFPPSSARAGLSVFYPSTCLGGWENVQNAEGRPDVIDGSFDAYTDTNSAVLKDRLSTIFCGKFEGEIPEYATSTKISLKFSWISKTLKDDQPIIPETVTNEVYDEDKAEKEAESAASTTPSEAASSTPNNTNGASALPSIINSEEKPEEIVAPPVEEKEETKEEPVVKPEEEKVEEKPTESEEAKEESVEEKEEPKVEEKEQEEEPQQEEQEEEEEEEEQSEPESSSQEESSGESSFLNSFFEHFTLGREVFAQENIEVSTTSAQEAEETEVPLEATAAEAIVPESVTESATSTETEEATPVPVESPALFVIKYTLDGVTWTELEKITSLNFYRESFEIPEGVLESISDISKLQIAIESMPFSDAAQSIYLDAMSVEIEFESLKVTEIVEREAFIVPTKPLQLGQERVWDIKGYSNGTVVMLTSSIPTPVDESTTTEQIVVTVPEADAEVESETEATTTDETQYGVTSLTTEGEPSPIDLPEQFMLWLVGPSGDVTANVDVLSPPDNFPLGLYAKHIIWLSNGKTIVNAYDLDKEVWYQKKIPAFDPALGQRGEVTFANLPWKIIIGSHEFYFIDAKGRGEVFSENDINAVNNYRKSTDFDTNLDEAEKSLLNLSE
ncbi:MAG: hypothetical protein V4526_01370 [Patescibacteria group bacterium]